MNATTLSPKSIIRPRQGVLAMLCAAFFVGAALAPQSYGQEEINEGYNKGVGLMQEGKWQEALTVFNQLVTDWGTDAAKIIGPAFGLIYYHVGFCEFQVKNYEAAAKAFQTTYEKFPNSIKKEGHQGANLYHQKSLYMWALSEQRNKKYEDALKRYEKFLNLKPKPRAGEDYQPYELLIDMAYCNIEIAGATEDAGIKRTKLTAGTKLLQKAYDAFERLRLKEEYQLYSTFLALAEKWVAGSMVREAMAFMDKNDGPLRWGAREMVKYKFNLRLLKLGQDAAGGGDDESGKQNLPSLSLRFFSFIPRLEDAVADIEARLKTGFRTEAQEKELKEEIDALKAQIASGKNADVTAMLLTAQIHEGKGNLRAAYAIYDYIVHHYKQAKIVVDKKNVPYHADALFHATRCSFAFGDLVTAQYHGLDFLKLYPGHKHEPAVQSMLLEYLFRAAEFARCIEIAENIEPKLAPGTKQHDLCLFVRGGSYFFEGRYKDAVEPLGKHVEDYPDSPYRAEVTYYNASNQVKMLEWIKAAKLLDAWLGLYPKNPLRPLALLDRAICHYAINELPETLSMIAEIESRYPESDIFDRALNLRGDVHAAKGEHVEAEAAYRAGKMLAESQGDASTAAESITQLIGVLVILEKPQEAAEFYHEFINNHGGHFLEPQAVANALPALIEIGEGEAGLKKMEQMILRLGTEKNADLEKAVNTYANNYIENYKAEDGAQKLVDRLKRWPQEEAMPAPVRAWLLITGIDVMEDKKHFNPEPKALINVIFRELMNMDRSELAPYVLARIISNLNAKGKGPEAIEFADEILSREGLDQKDVALYFKSASLAASPDRAKQDAAIAGFTEAIDKLQSMSFTDDSMHALGMLYIKRREWGLAEQWLYRYVKDKKLNKHNPEVWYNLAIARENQKKFIGKDGSAATAYQRVWSKYAGTFKLSCPAMNRSIEIESKYGKKQIAYDLAASWLRSMAKHTNHPVAGDYLRKTAILRDDLANDGAVVVPKKRK